MAVLSLLKIPMVILFGYVLWISLEQGVIKPQIFKTFPLEQVVEVNPCEVFHLYFGEYKCEKV
ncbi:hypothetical protein XBP1_2280006 [Xenorhabdus bovienii str. puntauvense]|uniref:Uncharacterized protein n=1 Tax=Xenorhabdus bovienii str. puntauvense TaxID=1398201 RepID=A0A077ND50_XENBV|nr:hypothetical protein XBP1_2280006 [Xenorhabdus bovienii str. puntauvense]